MITIIAVYVFTYLAMVALHALMAAGITSFLMCLADRQVAGESMKGRSHCVCGKHLSALQLVPVVGWYAQGGVSRCCGSPIPAVYPRNELTAAIFGSIVGAGTITHIIYPSPVTIPVVVVAVVGLVVVWVHQFRSQRRRATLGV